MKEKRYKLTEKGKKLLEEYNSNLNMQDFAAKLLGYDVKRDKNERC